MKPNKFEHLQNLIKLEELYRFLTNSIRNTNNAFNANEIRSIRTSLMPPCLPLKTANVLAAHAYIRTFAKNRTTRRFGLFQRP